MRFGWFFSTRHITPGGLIRAAGRGFLMAALIYPLILWLIGGWGQWFLGALYAGIVGTVIAQAETFFNHRPVMIRRGDGVICGLLTIIFLIYLMMLYGMSGPFPGHDGLLVPFLSRLMEQHGAPLTHRAMGPGQYYPPGMPAALGLMSFAAAPVTRLMAWKAMSLDALALAPVMWALVWRAWFEIKRPLWQLTLVHMVVLLCGVRDPVLGAYLKNAQLVSFSVLVPGFLWLLAGWRQYLIRWGWAALVLSGGLGLYYFTIVHFLAAWFGGAWVAGWVRQHVPRRHMAQILWLGLVWVVMVVVIWCYLGGMPQDSRLAPKWADVPWGWARVPGAWDALIGPDEKFWFIMSRWDAALIGVGQRRWLMLGCCIVWAGSSAWLWYRGYRRQAAVWGRFGLTALGGIGFLWLVATGLLPAGINFDYARWLVWPFQMMLMTAAIMAVTTPGLYSRWLVWPGAGIGALFWAIIIGADYQILQTFRQQNTPVTASDLHQFGDIMAGQDCLVLADTVPILGGLHHIARERIVDLVDVVTECRVVGGSFVQPPVQTPPTGKTRFFVIGSPEYIAAQAKTGISMTPVANLAENVLLYQADRLP